MKPSRPGKFSHSFVFSKPVLQPVCRRRSRSVIARPAGRLWLAGAAAAFLAMAGASAIAQTYLIDFGGANTTTYGPVPDDPTNYWNNVNNTVGGTSNGVVANLVTTQNSTSSISVVIIVPFNGANENGTQLSSKYPVDATRDSLYGNTGLWNGRTNVFPSFKLTGLDAATKYSLTFYASRTGVGDNREAGYTVTGGNSGFAALNAANNVDETVTVADITPDASGEIRIAIAPTANNDNPTTFFTYLGVLQVDAVPPQTPLAFTKQPAGQRVLQTKPVTFTCAVSGPPPHFVQWYENGAAIADATQFSYTIPAAELYMNGYQYSVTVSNLVYGVASSNAVLTVLSDTNPPTLVKAACYDSATIQLTFDEAMESGTVSDWQNYAVNNGAVPVVNAVLNADNRSATLTLSGVLSGNFTLVVNNVLDIAGNSIAPNSSIVGAVVSIDDQDFLFDFGGNNITELGPSPDDPANYWNNVTSGVGASDTGELSALVSVNNAQTARGLVMIRRFGGVNEAGTLLSTLFPSDATRDSMFGNTEVFQNLSNVFPSFKLTGLNPARQYSLTFYASRTSVGDNRETGYTVEGANTGFAALNAANNINNAAKVEGITPTTAGEITISLAPTANNNNANHFTYLGVMRLSPYVAPLKFLPPVIDAGKIKLQWTGTGQLERATSVNGSWTPITPAPTSPYQENLVPGENRFYRLRQ